MREPSIPEWTLADRLAKSRHAAGLSQDRMASKFEVNRATISQWEQGVRVPRAAYLMSWALITGVPLDWLRFGNYPDPGTDGSDGTPVKGSW